MSHQNTSVEDKNLFEIEVREILHRRVWAGNGECQISVGRVATQVKEKLDLHRVPFGGTLVICRLIESTLDFEIVKEGTYGNRVYQIFRRPDDTPQKMKVKEVFEANHNDQDGEWWEIIEDQLSQLGVIFEVITPENLFEELEHLFDINRQVQQRIKDCKKSILGGGSQ